ncbi:hypothetical protein KI387_022431 [Taxus chinensis]|uniref:2'-phosphotransferase n=1 Tax=Taxus chinensis TaxID=29808 RepID=A0AA38L5K8_TAXCH|nr:hypothetical protein KI387_022431 [Taxus chinensis]
MGASSSSSRREKSGGKGEGASTKGTMEEGINISVGITDAGEEALTIITGSGEARVATVGSTRFISPPSRRAKGLEVVTFGASSGITLDVEANFRILRKNSGLSGFYILIALELKHIQSPTMCSLRTRFSCLRQCNLAVRYRPFSIHKTFTTDKKCHVRWKRARVPCGPSIQLQHSKPNVSSPLFYTADRRKKDMVNTCISISVLPTTRNPSENHTLCTKAKGKGRALGYDERDEDDGVYSGRRRGGRGKGKGDKINALGRLMTAILRHKAEKLGLSIRSDGYVPVDEFLKLREITFAGIPLCSHTVDDVKEVIESDELLMPISSVEEVPVCVHGTYRKNLESILKTGLSRMQRRHVHFATGLPHDGDVISGMRRDIEILIFLDVELALKDAMKLYLSDNKVLLTEGFDGIVLPRYFAKIETWPKREPISQHVKLV